MNPIIEKLKTRRWGSTVTIDKAFVVGHIGFNKNDGFFAIYKIDSEIVGISIGDDGRWEEIFTFNKCWFKDILYIMNHFAKFYGINTKFKGD